MTLYDRIGRTYTATRREDPRIAARIAAALGDAHTVVNVGAGTGNYEPRDRIVTPIEPSAVMRRQRPPELPPAIEARAEALPFGDGAFDAAMAVLSDHHWSDRPAGLRELRRVAHRVVIFTWDDAFTDKGWIVRDYLPSVRSLPGGLPIAEIAAHLGGARIETVPIPADCRDGFLHAYWARPEAYLDPVVRDGISLFARLEESEVADFTDRLERDLASGAWDERNGHLRARAEIDLGYRLLVV